MTFYGESLLALGVLILIIAAGFAVILAAAGFISSKKLKSRLINEYGEKPKR